MRPQDLLDRLAAGYEYDPMYGALCNERDQLKVENTKLRELVRMMWKPFCWAQSGYDVCLTDEQDKAIRDFVRELGIEVD